MPLSKNRDALKEAIDAFGTAASPPDSFAWYMFSPNWANIWLADSTPAAYGTAKLRKIAVLMTDGVYNTLQAHSYDDNSSQAETARNEAVELCSKMKDKGIGMTTKPKPCFPVVQPRRITTTRPPMAISWNRPSATFALKIAFLRLTH